MARTFKKKWSRSKPEDVRVHQAKVALNDKELNKLNELADVNNVSRSELIRTVLFSIIKLEKQEQQ